MLKKIFISYNERFDLREKRKSEITREKAVKLEMVRSLTISTEKAKISRRT